MKNFTVKPRRRVELVAIGASLGGLHALMIMLSGLPAAFQPAIAIVQHRHKDSDEHLSGLLQSYCALPISEVDDKQSIEAGHVYLAPPDYHLLVDERSFALSTEAYVSFARPSIDVLFETAADAYGDRLIGVILTGANHDGARGLVAIKARGGLALVQDPQTAECRIMPEAAISAADVDMVLPLKEIAPQLTILCQTPAR